MLRDLYLFSKHRALRFFLYSLTFLSVLIIPSQEWKYRLFEDSTTSGAIRTIICPQNFTHSFLIKIFCFECQTFVLLYFFLCTLLWFFKDDKGGFLLNERLSYDISCNTDNYFHEKC